MYHLPWNAYQDQLLQERHLSGKSPEEIALELGRTPRAVELRLKQFAEQRLSD